MRNTLRNKKKALKKKLRKRNIRLKAKKKEKQRLDSIDPDTVEGQALSYSELKDYELIEKSSNFAIKSPCIIL